MGLDIFNWDVVGALNYDQVNAAIATSGASPTRLQQTASAGGSSMDITCGTWRLTTGGSGENILIEVPITGGTVTIQGNDFTLDPSTSTTLFSVDASYLPQPGNSARRELRLSDKRQSGTPPSASPPTPAQANVLVQAELSALLTEWVQTNLQEFNHVFAVVDLEVEFEHQPGFTWMRPWHIGYAVKEPDSNATTANSVFAVLALIDEPGSQAEKDVLTSRLTYQVDLGAIPAGKDGGLAVSSAKTLKHMFLPVAPLMFGNKDDYPPMSDFTLHNDGTAINNNKKLTMQKMKLDNGKEVQPYVNENNFEISIDGKRLKIGFVDASYDYALGVVIKLTMRSENSVKLTSDNHFTLNEEKRTGGGSVTTTVAVDVLSIAAGVVSFLAACVGAGAGKVAKVAEVAAEGLDAASISLEEVSGGSEAAQEAETATICGGMITGTAPELESLGARLMTVAKVAGATSFVFGTPAVVYGIVAAIANGQSSISGDLEPFFDAAMEKAMSFPNTPKYRLTSAELDTNLIFGLTKS
ncbi:TULIP family P47-like protein [Litorivita sp. NS0012-18]|uniref:TULIP family P47-like protein n=1 Tax=Litorivita sp. NS0012-18 TaxID=3127655 RepID=UPI00310333A4